MYRSYDFQDLLVNTQKTTRGNAPIASPHYLGLSIGESDVFDCGTALLASIKANPTTQYLGYIAVGTDASPLDPATQTTLIAEVYRDAITIWNPVIPLSSGSSTLFNQLFLPKVKTAANVHLREFAILDMAGTTMLCRQLLDFDNTTPLDLLLSWLLTFN